MDHCQIRDHEQTASNQFPGTGCKSAENCGAGNNGLQGHTDADLQSKLDDATFNLTYAESDESGGFHKNTYLMALLNDAQQKAQEVLKALGK